LSDIHADTPIPTDVVDRLTDSVGRLRDGVVDRDEDRESVSLDV
jgi:hypothetical protein